MRVVYNIMQFYEGGNVVNVLPFSKTKFSITDSFKIVTLFFTVKKSCIFLIVVFSPNH